MFSDVNFLWKGHMNPKVSGQNSPAEFKRKDNEKFILRTCQNLLLVALQRLLVVNVPRQNASETENLSRGVEVNGGEGPVFYLTAPGDPLIRKPDDQVTMWLGDPLTRWPGWELSGGEHSVHVHPEFEVFGLSTRWLTHCLHHLLSVTLSWSWTVKWTCIMWPLPPNTRAPPTPHGMGHGPWQMGQNMIYFPSLSRSNKNPPLKTSNCDNQCFPTQ